MSQATNWGVPAVGPATPTVMASRMNESLNALRALHRGATRPDYAVAGTLWLDDSAGTVWSLKMFDGDAADAVLAFFDSADPAFQLPYSNATSGLDATNLQDAVDEVAGKLGGGLRNLIDNARGTINQRGYTSGSSTSTANQYTVDRWFVVTSGQNVSWTESEGVRTFTAPAGGFGQVIEGERILGGTYVLNWEGTATATVNGTARAKGESFTLTGGANAVVRFFSGTMSKPQLEPGAVPTPFEQRPVQIDEYLCKRRHQKSYHIDVAPGTATSQGVEAARRSVAGETETFFNARFEVEMAATPAVTWYDHVGTVNSLRHVGIGFITVTGVSESHPISRKSPGSPTHASNGGPGDRITGHWVAVAELTP